MLKLKVLLNRATIELKKTGIQSAELDARVLLEHAIHQNTPYVFTHPEAPICHPDYARFRRYIRKRKAGEPVAYILGYKEFYGLDFIVNKNTLVPRPETELLVEESIAYCQSLIANRKKAISHKQLAICDIGTGSGNIIISLAKQLTCLPAYMLTSLYATDISKKALTVAKKNGKKHGVADMIHFYHSDLFSNKRLPKKLDIIIANLPYVPITPGVKKKTPGVDGISFEPQSAIFAENNGTSIIKRFIEVAKEHINSNGLILIELDPRNAKELLHYSKSIFAKVSIELKKDLAGLDRYLKIIP